MFSKVLIANRGEIAVRVIRTCRKLGIKTVAVFSDADAEALHVSLADETFHLGASRAQDSYLNVVRLSRAIADSGCDAVHPGYGLLSEDAQFAATVRAAGVEFVGPSEQALKVFGDKLAARKFARKHGAQVPPGTAEPLDASDLASLEAIAAGIGYPVLVKAAAGGGGIGMQPVLRSDQLLKAIETCTARGRAAFADERVYLERYFAGPRHIEAQVLVDSRGSVVVLGERECSVQRRHQKVLEESPSPGSFWTPELRERLLFSAGELLRQAQYVGAGTVEFLLDTTGPEPEFYFLEVNARLQVEHPVTELCYGVDLVEQQLRIAAGEALSEEVREAIPRGHAVEVRLYAEDPSRKFMPQPGRLETLTWPPSALAMSLSRDAGPVFRIDAGYQQGDEITPYYDPLIAKLICWADSRSAALDHLAAQLDRTEVRLAAPKGSRTTNLAFLRALLDDPRLRSGDYDTTLLGA